jgi:hypothetical protein
VTARRAILTVVAAVCMMAAPVLACSYDGEDNGLSVDTLNHYYPDSYGVVLSVLEARRAGRLERFTAEPTPKLVALQRVTRALRDIDGLRTPHPGSPDVAVLLVESMFWARYPDGRRAEVHLPGPQPGDVVVITSEDVIAGIAARRITVAQAEAAGWLMLYGRPDQITATRAAYAAIGS